MAENGADGGGGAAGGAGGAAAGGGAAGGAVGLRGGMFGRGSRRSAPSRAAQRYLKNTLDDDDTFFPFSPLTIAAIKKKNIENADAIALQPPIAVLLDMFFPRGNTSGSSINAPFPYRALRGSRVQRSAEYLERPIFRRDVHEICTAAEIDLYFGTTDLVLPGLTPMEVPELRPNAMMGMPPPVWEKLNFNPTSHIDLQTNTETNNRPRELISAAQSERIHHAACTRSSR